MERQAMATEIPRFQMLARQLLHCWFAKNERPIGHLLRSNLGRQKDDALAIRSELNGSPPKRTYA